MKTMLIGMFVALLLVGCGGGDSQGNVDMEGTGPNEDALETAVEWFKLHDRSGVTYLPNTDKPFSGCAKRAYENEQVEVLAQFKDGYVVRLKQWQENGTPRWDVGYMEGIVGIAGMPYKREPAMLYQYRHGPVTLWHENGQKQLEGNFKYGKPDGLETEWYENGQKKGEGTIRDGKLVSAKVWKPNGEKFSLTNWKDGNGVMVGYNEDGTDRTRTTFKDAERVD